MGWDLSTASYDSVSFSVSSQTTSPIGVTFSADGSKMYVVGAPTTIYQYSLSTAWDLSSASYASKSYNVNGQTTRAEAVAFKSDGTKMYVLAGSTNDAVLQYSLSTAWDVSTATYDSVSFSVATQDSAPLGVTFKGDGTKMYVTATTNNAVFQYALSTAWDLTTASYESKSLTTTTQTASPQESAFRDNGTRLYVCQSAGTQGVHQYDLSTAWDVSTAAHASFFSTNTEDSSCLGVAFKSDGSKMYVCGNGNDRIYQYSVAGSDGGWQNGAVSMGSS